MAVPSRLRWLLPGHSLLPATGLGIAHDPLQVSYSRTLTLLQ